jgi:hypothetical protein
MPAKTTTAARKPPTRRKKPVPRARVGKGLTVPKTVPLHARLGMRVALLAASQLDAHKATVMSRKDAAILRYTHRDCPTCRGNGQIFTKGKDGSFTGSKPCPAKPTHAKAGRLRVAMAARFGADKNTGLIGWTCPCGTKTKPKFRDAKDATKALRAHEKQRHGGKSVGGAWYAQATEGQQGPGPAAPAVGAPVSKTSTNPATLSDADWLKQNSTLAPAAAKKRGACAPCGGSGALYSINAGTHTTTVCPLCTGTGKPTP